MRALLPLLGLLVLGACAEPEDAATTARQATTNPLAEEVSDPRFDAYLTDMMEKERFTGAALVMQGGNVLHAKGYGKATSEIDNEVTTEFHVASVTKQFTAAAIMQLVEKGMIELNRSINNYLPEQYRTQRWDVVTVHHLLSHTGGVPDYAVERDYYDVVDGFCLGDTVDGMIREAMATPLDFIPGTQHDYSNIGFTLLGYAIEQVTGEPYADYMRDHLLEPMGMHSSRLHVIGHTPTATEAAGHRWNEELGTHVKDEVVTLPVTAPDGGLVTTLGDFVRWTNIYFGEPQTVLKPESIERMTSPVHAAYEDARGLPQSYGYGLYVSEDLLSHSGYIVGFRSHFLLDRDQGILIAVFSNNTTNVPSNITAGLLKILESPAS